MNSVPLSMNPLRELSPLAAQLAEHAGDAGPVEAHPHDQRDAFACVEHR